MAQYGFSYLQSVTKNLALGVDFLYLGRPPYPGAPPFSSLTAGLRYSTARDQVLLSPKCTSRPG